MPSIIHRDEWNSLASLASSRGIVVRPVTGFRTEEYGRLRVARLRERLGLTLQSTTAITPIEMTAEIPEFTFGVELEFKLHPDFGSRWNLKEKLIEAGIQASVEIHLTHATPTTWKITTDGSVGRDERSIELVSPPLSGSDGLDQLRRVCRVLTAARCKITKRCGFHVHVGARGRSVEFFRDLVEAYMVYEPVIDLFMPASRRGSDNTYCSTLRTAGYRYQYDLNRKIAALKQAGTHSDVARIIDQNTFRSHGRYKKLNLEAFWQHGTVEFRHHSGTVEADKAVNWVRFCLAMCMAAEGGAPLVDSTFDGLMAYVSAEPAMVGYLRSRMNYFTSSRRAA